MSNFDMKNGTKKKQSLKDFMKEARNQIKFIGFTLLFLLAMIFLNYLINHILKLDTSQQLYTFLALLLIIVISIYSSGNILKMFLMDKFSLMMHERISQLDDLVSSKRIELESLVKTCIQLKEILKGEKKWLLDDEQVLIIEENTDKEIIVIVSDLYYEEQPNYMEVIIKNLLKECGPTYHYIIPHNSENLAAVQEIQTKLAYILKEHHGIEDPMVLIHERFKIKLIEEFPHPVLYGMAIYTNKNGRMICIQYLPREIGTMNINIPLEDESLGKRLFLRNRQLIDRILKEKK